MITIKRQRQYPKQYRDDSNDENENRILMPSLTMMNTNVTVIMIGKVTIILTQ